MHDFVDELRRAAPLSFRIFRGTIGAKYRKSFLGYFWMIVPAVLISGGVTLANLAGAISPGVTNLPYPLFVFTGVLIWLIFAEVIDVPYMAFDGARSYLTRVNFPREAIVLVQLYESLIGAAARLVFLCVVVAAYDLLTPSVAVMLLVAFLTAVLLGLGIGMLLAPFMILFEDLRNVVRLVVSYGVFISSAFYSPQHGLFATLVKLNPASHVMDAARAAIAANGEFMTPAFLATLLAGIALTVLGILLIRLAAPIVVERMLLGGR